MEGESGGGRGSARGVAGGMWFNLSSDSRRDIQGKLLHLLNKSGIRKKKFKEGARLLFIVVASTRSSH